MVPSLNPQAYNGVPVLSSGPNKKALLIGIRYKNGRWPASSSRESMDLGDAPHMETEAWRNILTRGYGYRDNEITCMQDISKYQGNNQWPNKENILAQFEDLVRGAKPGDRRFLFIAAHGNQLPVTSDWTEFDGRDEIMYTLEKDKTTCRIIKDNDLRRILVDSLPAGVHLTVVLDLCHSGTLMDLPWQLNRSERGSPILEAKKNPTNTRGNILCISACEDAQNAYQFSLPDRPAQGIITAIIQYSLAQTSGTPNLRVKDLLRCLVQFSGNPEQIPTVTLGRILSREELETLVFQP